MSRTQSSTFVPIKAEDLRVGMYVKLDCHWLKHPIPRNKFKVQSAAEIAVILRLGQLAIYVDASRSDPESLTKVQVPETAVGNHQEASQAPPTLVHGSEEKQSIINKKEEHIQAYLRCQEGLKKAAADHAATLRETKDVIDQVSAGREGCASKALEWISRMTRICSSRILRPTELPPKVMEYWNPRRVAGYFFQIRDDTGDSAKKR